MLIIGLTGGIGVGKTTVCSLLAKRGAHVIDVDELGSQIIRPGGIAVDTLKAHFGDSVGDNQGGIDRPALASIVFEDEEQLAALNAISHPFINELLDERVEESSKDSIIIFDMAVLVESSLGYGTRNPYEIVVTVEAPMKIRIERLEQRGLSAQDANSRIESQASDEDRRAVSQFIVTNGGDIDELEVAVDELWVALQKLDLEKNS